MKDRFIKIYQEKIHREGSEELLDWLETSGFFTAPASTRFHLCRPGGLLEHSLNVYDRLDYLMDHEPTNGGPLLRVTDESIAIAALLHDVCKADAYKQEPKNQKTYDPEKVKAAQKWQVKHDSLGDFIWETVLGYKFDEELVFGHGEKSVYIVSSFMRLTLEEATAIRWHMGGFDVDQRNAGNAFGKYPLAVMLHTADLMATYLDEKEEQ